MKAKSIIFTCICILLATQLSGQNTGIGTISPTHTLHVKTVNGNVNPDPVRIEGLLDYLATGDSAILLVNPDSGIVRILHIDSLMRRHGVNIYNTDGSLQKNITMNMNSYGLTFLGTDTIYFSPDGRFGIGTTSLATLHHVVKTKLPLIPSTDRIIQSIIENNGEAGIAILASKNSQSHLLFGDQDAQSPGAIIYEHPSDQMEFKTNGSVNMMIDSSGFVGIGTSDPLAPLHISTSQNLNPEAYINGGDNDNVYSNYADEYSSLANVGSGKDYSVIAEERIAAHEFNAYSDFRIKKDIQDSDAEADLDLIRALDVKVYKYIDPIKNGEELKKGFLAQEVETVFSQAVGRKTGIIPNIFQTPTDASWKEGMVRIQLAKPHTLKVGSKVKLICADGERIIQLKQTPDSLSFLAQTPELDATRIFVYGSEVSDFHTLDYDEIFTLNVSATQALADKVDHLSKTLEQQQALIQQLIQQNQSLQTQLKELNKR